MLGHVILSEAKDLLKRTGHCKTRSFASLRMTSFLYPTRSEDSLGTMNDTCSSHAVGQAPVPYSSFVIRLIRHSIHSSRRYGSSEFA